MAKRRAMLLSLLALAVPTFAFGGEDAPAPASLSVSASLGSCGLAEAAIVCEVSVSWNAVDDADYYSVSVTRPDGSVIDFGQASGAGRSLYVPYAGPGSYAIEVAAWGTPPGADEPEVLTSEKSLSSPAAKSRGVASDAPAETDADTDSAEADATDAPQAEPEGEAASPEPEPSPEATDCQPPPVEPDPAAGTQEAALAAPEALDAKAETGEPACP